MTPPAQIVIDREQEMLISFRMLDLIDFDHAELRVVETAGSPDEIGRAGVGMIAFICREGVPLYRVHFQVWDGRPAESGAAPGFEDDLDVQHVDIGLCTTTGSPTDLYVELPAPGVYRVRAYRDDDPDRWLIQMWPKG